MNDPEQDSYEPGPPLPMTGTSGELLPASTEYSARSSQFDSFPPWSVGDVAAVLGFTLAVVMVCSVLALGVARVVTGSHHAPLRDLASNPLVIIGSQIAAYPIVIAFMMMLVRNKAGEPFWRAIRWNWPSGLAALFLSAGTIFAFVVEFASRYLPIPKSLPVDKFFNETTGAYLMAGFGVTLAPLLEELFFRGMLYPLVRRISGVIPAILLTTTAFALIHGAQLGYAWAPLLSIFVVGLVFTLVREHTGSVAASFLMHCGYNLALFGTLWVASDGFRHLEKVVD